MVIGVFEIIDGKINTERRRRKKILRITIGDMQISCISPN